jgi:superfamily II DNA or RNA helicase
VQLRGYQSRAIEYALDHLAKQKRSVIQLPTGTGKSLVLLAIAQRAIRAGKRVYIIAPTVEAMTQFRRLCLLIGLCAVCDIGERRAPRLASLILTTYATAWRRFKRHAVPESLLLLDECHHVNYLAPVNAAILSAFPLAVGTSATPWSAGCLRFFDGNRHTYRLSDSIAAGHNAPYRIASWCAPQAIDSPIIYASTGDYLREICQSLRASDYAIYQRRNARQVIQRYRNALLKAIVVRRMLTEGFDNPQCKAVYIARETLSRIAAMQMAGRALRPHKGKTATIFVHDAQTRKRLKQALRKAG